MVADLQRGSAARQPRPGAAPHVLAEAQNSPRVYLQSVYLTGKLTRTPQLNGKVERSHRTDKQEFYQLLTYTGDVDLQAKLAEWENFYNYHRPHGAFQGKTPYEALREKLA